MSAVRYCTRRKSVMDYIKSRASLNEKRVLERLPSEPSQMLIADDAREHIVTEEVEMIC